MPTKCSRNFYEFYDSWSKLPQRTHAPQEQPSEQNSEGQWCRKPSDFYRDAGWEKGVDIRWRPTNEIVSKVAKGMIMERKKNERG